MKKKILFTGGGSSGHVTPNISLINELFKQGWRISYIGSKMGIEKSLITQLKIPYEGISTGKLRRYFSWQNFVDPFKIIVGIFQALKILFKLKPSVVFSKGGFVAFPVVVAAWLLRVSVIAHESDITPGLANKLSFPFCKKVCLTFSAAIKYFKNKDKIVLTGTPIRASLFNGDKQRAMEMCQFKSEKPVLMVIGGGQGSKNINSIVRVNLNELLETFNIVHLCGKAKVSKEHDFVSGYRQFEYVSDGMADLYSLADIVISRSGANSVYEILALKKPHIFIPLPLSVSRGDQIHNARYFEKLGVSKVLNDETLSANEFKQSVAKLYRDKEDVMAKINALKICSGTPAIIKVIQEVSNG